MGNDENKVKWLKILLWFGALYHVLFALVGILGKEHIVTLAKVFYGFNLTMTPQVAWILNPLAAYMLAFGLFLGVAATDPLKYKNVIYAALIFIVVRVIQRVFFLVSASNSFIAGDTTKNIVDISSVVLYALVLFIVLKNATYNCKS